ncbi:MAG TPA: hypothetical protein VGL19_00590, partial [Polyangiaceae bacterium]
MCVAPTARQLQLESALLVGFSSVVAAVPAAPLTGKTAAPPTPLVALEPACVALPTVVALPAVAPPAAPPAPPPPAV